MMAHTEWTLRALDELDLPMDIRIREALTLPALVITVALSLAQEAEAEQETGTTLHGWWLIQRKRADALLNGEPGRPVAGRAAGISTVSADTLPYGSMPTSAASSGSLSYRRRCRSAIFAPICGSSSSVMSYDSYFSTRGMPIRSVCACAECVRYSQ